MDKAGCRVVITRQKIKTVCACIPDPSGDNDVTSNVPFGGAFDPTTSENLYAFPPPVPEKQFDLNDSYDPELLQTGE